MKLCKHCQNKIVLHPSDRGYTHLMRRIFCSKKCAWLARTEKAKQRTEKNCNGCNETLPINCFSWKITGKLRQNKCKKCSGIIQKKSNIKHIRKRKATKRRYYLNNKEEIIKNVAFWNKSNPQKRVKYMVLENAKRRALKYGNGSDFDRKQWLEVMYYCDNKCIYCEREIKLSIDHFVPLVLGGSHSLSNIVPSCLKCNWKKNKHNPYSYIPSVYGEERLLIIMNQIDLIKKALDK